MKDSRYDFAEPAARGRATIRSASLAGVRFAQINEDVAVPIHSGRKSNWKVDFPGSQQVEGIGDVMYSMKFLRDGHLGAALPYRKRNSTGGFAWFQSGGTLVFSRILFYGPEMIHEWDPQQWDESAIKADLKTFGDVEIFWYDDDGGVADRLPLSEIHRLMTDRRRVDYQQPKDTTYTFQVREEVPGGRLDVEADKPEPASITTTSSSKAPETDMAASASKPKAPAVAELLAKIATTRNEPTPTVESTESDEIDLAGCEWNKFQRAHYAPVDVELPEGVKLNIWVRSNGTGKVRCRSEQDMDGVIVDFGDIEVPLRGVRPGWFFAELTTDQVGEIIFDHLASA